MQPAEAQSLPVSAFQPYNPATASSIQPGPFALYSVPVDLIQPGQMNVGFSEVARKMYGWDLLTPSQLQAALLADIEPVVIGPGGILILENGHHTFTSLQNSAYGATDPSVFVDVVANFSNLTTAQFWATLQADGLLLPLSDGVPQIVTSTGAPIPTSLQGLTNDPYRGLEESILKNESSKLFTTSSNITGAAGPIGSNGKAEPGLDKLTGDYSDFLWADAYRNAKGGLGLPYLSAGDVALATQWNLNPNSTTTLPNIGTITIGQMPGFILNQNLTIGSTISNATLSTGTLAANGTFTGITQFNLGTPSNPILVGTAQSGFVMQLGFDSGFSVTLSGNNTYTGGTTLIAGNLIVTSDAALGAAPPAGYVINPNAILASVQAANGIIFNSEDEGMATLQIGTTSGGGTQTFTTNRPIAVDGETATINPNGYIVTLNGQIVSLGTNGSGLGNESGISPLTINDTSSGAAGVVILPASANNSGFYGNWIITAGTLNVSSDAALGNTVGPSYEIGQIELNGGTLQAGASFGSVRTLFLGGGSTYDTNGFTTSWAGTLTDVQRTLTIANSNTSGTGAVGNVTFGSLAAGSTAILALDAGGSASTTGGPGTTVTFTNGITRNGDSSSVATPNATVFINPATGSTLGASGANGVQVFSGGASATLTNGIVPVWIVTDSGGSASTNPYNFLTYSGANGYQIATYTSTFGASNVVEASTSQTLNANTQAYALNVQNSKNITIASGDTLTIGNGSNPAGLILEGTTTTSGGTLAFGSSEAVIYVKGTNTISSAVTGSGGLTVAGSGTLVLSGTAGGLTGAINVDSGTLQLNTANYFSTSGGGTTLWLSDVKSKPSASILQVDASNIISALNSDGSNSTVNIATGTTLTVGDSNNLNSTLSSTIAGTGTGSLVKAGSGLLDISGSGGVSFGTGGSVTVSDGALRIGNGLFSTSATTPITVDAGAELQYSGNSGSKFNDPISGAGVFHLVGGTVQLTSTSNSYTGGTVLEVGTTLDVTTANLPANAQITNAGGILLFDQSTTGTFTGVMTDGQQAGGPNNPNDMSCTLVTCVTGKLSGTLIKDDSTTGSGGNVTIANVQAYTGMTYIEAGTLTLGAVNTIATSSGVVLGRIGGSVCNPSPCSGVTATLALGANNAIQGLADDAGNKTSVTLNSFTLTLMPLASTTWSYAGSIVDGSATGGNLIQNGAGTSILYGTSTYTGATAVNAGVLDVEGIIANTSGATVNNGGTLAGGGTIDPPAVLVNAGGTLAPGTPGIPGTAMTIVGNLVMQAGSFYFVQLNATAASFANVTGTATLGGSVFLFVQPGSIPLRQDLILQSAGLIGTFASVSSNIINFTESLSYTATNVVADFTAALGLGSGLPTNQQNVANGINNFYNNGGLLPPNFAALFGLTGSSLNAALTQLDGEAATGAERAAFQMTTQFLNLMLDPFVDGRFGGVASGSQAIGFAPGEQQFLPSDVARAYNSILNSSSAPATFAQRWTPWGAAYGGASTTNGVASVGSNNVSAQTFGFAAGTDYHFSPDTIFGFALAGGGTSWALGGGVGGGGSSALQSGAYGITRLGPAYIAGALSFTNHWITDNRSALGNGLMSQFSAQSYAARIEGGYRFAVLPTFGATPYAAVQVQDFMTPSYSEMNVVGAGFGLNYAAMNAVDVRTELGGRFDSPQVIAGMPLILRTRFAWAHDFANSPSVSAAFQALPGSNFIVNGAPIPNDSALVSGGAEFFVAPNWTLLAKFDGEFANGSQTYAGTGTLRYTW